MGRPSSSSRHLRWAGLASVVALATALSACSGGTPPAPTVKVDRGDVSLSVSASGTLVSIKQQNLGFNDRGKLAELMVKVGDVVAAGQPLARLDDSSLRQALESAQAKLDQQKATLGKTTGSNSVDAAQDSAAHLKSILSATQAEVDATNDSDTSATDRAQVQLDFDQKVLDKAKDDLDDCEDSPAASGSRSNSKKKNSMADSDSTAMSAGATPTTPTTTPPPDCTTTAESALQTAKRSVIASQTALDAAQHKQQTDAASGRVSVENAKKAVSDAQNDLTGAQNDAPADTAVQEAVVRDAQATVDGAQRDLDAATLKAPIAGTVSAINGSVGEFIAASSGGASLAPGSDARAPSSSSGASTDSGAGGAGGTGGGGGAFLTLNNIDTYQLVVPFEEADAAKVAPNQKVDVSVDAIPGLTKPGTVVAVAPAGQNSNGVVNYNTTIVLNETDPRLKDGQTAEADVNTQTVQNVLRVPTAAVRQDNGRSVVNVMGPDGKPQPVPFTPGLAGDQFTEVTGGLQQGQDILLPQAQVAGAGTGGPGGGGGG